VRRSCVRAELATASFRTECGVTEDESWTLVDSAALSGTVPWRTFRWYRGQRHYSGTYWSSVMSGHVIYESGTNRTPSRSRSPTTGPGSTGPGPGRRPRLRTRHRPARPPHPASPYLTQLTSSRTAMSERRMSRAISALLHDHASFAIISSCAHNECSGMLEPTGGLRRQGLSYFRRSFPSRRVAMIMAAVPNTAR
jgi:hypothetical protein